MDSFYVGAYWKARKESVAECTDRLSEFLSRLSASHEVYSTWYEKGMKRRNIAQKKVDISDRSRLVGLLVKGRSRADDVKRSIIEDLGFSVSLWNGQPEAKAVSFNVACGIFFSSPHFANCVVLDLPDALQDFAQSSRVVEVVRLVAECWEPDWGGAISRMSREQRGYSDGGPFVDWIVYLSDAIATVAAVPAPSRVERVGRLGSIVVVQDEPVALGGPAHLDRLARVERAISFTTREEEKGSG